MKSRNLVVCLIVFFVVSVLGFSQMQEVEWGDVKGTASATVFNTSFDEVWNHVQNILLFEKFKPKGSVFKVKHTPITMEKESGLFIVNGHMGSKGGLLDTLQHVYVMKVSIQSQDAHIVVRIQCTGTWKKRAVVKFFQLLGKKYEGTK